MSDTLTDIAGQTINPGDTVVYPQMSGRSVQMVLGKLLKCDGKTAQIERLEGARWSTGHGGTRYRDKRTGKGIDPYAPSGKHYKVKPREWYAHKETGEEISYDEYRRRYPMPYYGYQYPDNYKIQRQMWEHHVVAGEWHDYVESYKAAPKPVTIQNVSNIVKVQVVSE